MKYTGIFPHIPVLTQTEDISAGYLYKTREIYEENPQVVSNGEYRFYKTSDVPNMQ